ncbi:MAG: cytochrome c3 family protein [Phycisphaerales bacterium]
MSTIFPKWMNALPTLGAIGALGTATVAVGAVWYYFTPKYWDVGYMPTQPGGGFNHQIHAGKLGMDCRYCHTKVESSAEANIPNVATCFGCHSDNKLKLQDPQVNKDHKGKTDFIREAYAADKSIEWRRIHKLPDYVRNFPHSAHIAAGVSCFSCHGNIARSPVVWQQEPLSMSWCLDCHRDPAPNIVPKDKVTNLFWVENRMKTNALEARATEGAALLKAMKFEKGPEGCGTCHY